jgi:hypothetical protein
MALIVFFFVTIIYLSSALFGPSSGSLRLSRKRPPPKALYVEDQIKVNEMRYQEHLMNRKSLIKKYGPTRDEVVS